MIIYLRKENVKTYDPDSGMLTTIIIIVSYLIVLLSVSAMCEHIVFAAILHRHEPFNCSSPFLHQAPNICFLNQAWYLGDGFKNLFNDKSVK